MVVLGIALGVAMYIATQATARSMLASFDEIVSRISGQADMMVVADGGVSSTLTAELSTIVGVAHAAPALEVTTQFASTGEPLLVLGVDFLGDTHFLPYAVADGDTGIFTDPLAFVNDPSALLISRSLARRHKLHRGSSFDLVTAEGVKSFSVHGILEDEGALTSFGGQVAVGFLDAVQVSFARGFTVDRIDIAIDKGADRADVRYRVQQAVGGERRVETPERIGARLRDLTEPLAGGLFLSGIVSLWVGIFLIYNAVGIAVAQRRKEVGLLRSLGVTQVMVTTLFCAEAVMLALPGVALGLVMARELAEYSTQRTLESISRIYVAIVPAKPEISFDLVLQAIFAGVFIAVAAAFIPARRAANLDPAEALRASAKLAPSAPIHYRRMLLMGIGLMVIAWIPGSSPSRAGGAIATLLQVAGSAMSAPGIVMGLRRILLKPAERLLGIPARLALDYVARTLGRSSVNVLALMVAVAMSVSVGGWLSSFERSLRSWFEQVTAADLTITAGSPLVDKRHVAFSASVLDKLANLPGTRLQPVRLLEQSFRDKRFQLVASDTAAFLKNANERGKPWQVLDGRTPIEPDELAAAPMIVLSENAAHRLGLRAGDSMPLATPSGFQTFGVRAVVVDYTSELGAGFIDRSHYEAYWNDPMVDAVNVYVAERARVPAVATAIRTLLGDQAVFVTTTVDLRERFIGLVREAFAYSETVEIITLLIALMGVIGTMMAAVLDRVGEIGVLRAIGTRRSQVVLAIVVEAAFLGLCATTAGVLSGAVQCVLFLRTTLFANTGWHLSFAFPYESTARITILVILTAALAGMFPGIRAARRDVKDALGYE